MEEKKIAIITARGGSKRIPKKNIKDFCGKPIIAYSIQAALDSGIFDEVMVSTDSEEISEIARIYGANVPFMRSKKTSDDYSTTDDVLMEVLEEYKNRGEAFTYMACIYPTAPFVTAEKLRTSFLMLVEKEAELVMPVVPFSYPPQRGWISDGEQIKMKYPEHQSSRSQDLEIIYHDCGQFYFHKVREFMEKRDMKEMKIIPMIMNELEVQDIDNEIDWRMAEMKYRMMMEAVHGEKVF